MKLLNFKILIIVLATMTLLQPVVAAEDTKPEPTKPVGESVNELLSIRDDTSLSEEEKLAKELEIREKILAEVLSLSLNEVAKLTAKINNLPEFIEDSRERTLQNEFRKALESYNAYYTDQSKKLQKLTTIDEVKKLAQEIKDYRDNLYNPQVQQIVNFVLVFYNEEVLKIATVRLDKISADIKKLEKLGYLQVGTFSNELKRVTEILNSAHTLQQEAKVAILTPPDKLAQTVAGDEEKQPIEPNKLIEESLNKVKTAYDIFLQIGKNLRKILGIK